MFIAFFVRVSNSSSLKSEISCLNWGLPPFLRLNVENSLKNSPFFIYSDASSIAVIQRRASLFKHVYLNYSSTNNSFFWFIKSFKLCWQNDFFFSKIFSSCCALQFIFPFKQGHFRQFLKASHDYFIAPSVWAIYYSIASKEQPIFFVSFLPWHKCNAYLFYDIVKLKFLNFDLF